MKHTSSITNYLDMETKELFNIYSNDKSNKEVRDILIERNLYLVSILAKKYINKGVEFEDLYQVGSLALIYAIERYDISKGYEFSSFATPTIIGEIKKYFRDKVWTMRVPRRVQELNKKVNEAKLLLEQQNKKKPKVNEIAEYIGCREEEVLEALEASYHDNKSDEFVLPCVVNENGKIKNGDSVVFFNFRPDRAREITRAIVDTDFAGFERPNMNTFFVCLTTYDVTIKNVNVAFKPQSLENTLGEYLSSKGKSQLRAAETEKYAHVTFFFNGGVEEANDGEDRLLVPSPKVATYDLQPEMSAYELTDKLLSKIDEDRYDLIVVNYANPDMVGHTGVMEAAVKAVEAVDTCVGKVVDKILSKGGAAIITADHGNAEYMWDANTESTVTAHSTNPVPFMVVGEELKDAKLKEDGRLSDIAPTILDMMNLEKPEQMTGHSLIK